MNRLADTVALITGGSRGIGAATAKLFAEEGARVVIADVLDDDGQAAVAEITAAGGAAAYHRLDVVDPASWEQVVAFTESTYGRLDVLVNNAGITDTFGLDTTTLESWNRMIDVDQTGPFLGMKYCVPALRRAGGGSIVNLSSMAGIVGIPGSSIAYTAAKGAVRLMTKFAAVELAKEGIRVNSVHPGRVDSPMVANQTAEKIAFMLEQTPLGRNATPLEIAYGVLYLASKEAGFTTGAELVIDGGFTAR